MKKRLIAIVLIITLFVGLFNHSGLSVSAGEILEETTTSTQLDDAVTTEIETKETESVEAAVTSQYEDLTISANTTLSESLEVGNLTVTGGTLNLSGNTITVHGDVIFSGGAVTFNSGTIYCEGSFTYATYGNYTMDSANDYLYVGGDFVWERGYCGAKNGIIEIKGNFFDNASGSYVFKAQGNNIVIFSGAGRQTITQSDKTTFGIVEINNFHPEGVYSETVLVAQEIRTNESVFAYPVTGVKGWVLEADETYEGDLLLISDELDLNGHTLTVTGNFIQMSGNVNVNGGKLIVNGDYRSQSVKYVEIPAEDESGEVTVVPEYSYGGGSLFMTTDADEVHVGGDFVMQSMQDHSAKLTAGTLYVEGDFSQKKASEKNFAAGKTHRVILDGKEAQKVSFESAHVNKSHVASMELTNTSVEGVIFDGTVLVTGELFNTDSVTCGYVDVWNGATFKDNYYKGDVRFATTYQMNTDVTIEGKVRIESSWLYMTSKSLTVKGDIEAYNAVIYPEGGGLICMGALKMLSGKGQRSYLNMIYDNDYVLVHGDMEVNSEVSAIGVMKAGTLEIKGDFTQNVTNYEDNFTVTGTHKTIFSGDKKQTVTFNSTKSFFNIVELKNTSVDGIYCPQYFNFKQIIKNDVLITYEKEGSYGWTLEADETVAGDLHLAGDELNLNGHTLVIEGNLIQEAGTVNVNGGTLVVKGDYRLQTEASGENGEAVYASGHGRLRMTGESDTVQVLGDFVMDSVMDHTEFLTGGKLYIGGDFTQLKSSEKNFATGGSHQTIFNGAGAQSISFESTGYNKSYFANLAFENTSAEGVTVTTDVLVMSELANTESVVNGYVTLYRTGTLKDNYYKGYVKIDSGYQLYSDMIIDGKLYLTSSLYLRGFNLKVTGDVDVYNGIIHLGGGRMECGGDLNMTSVTNSRSYLQMTNANDYVLVCGNVNWSSALGASGWLTAGTLEIKGDFTQTIAQYEDNFTATGTHKVILSGDKKQTVTFNSDLSYFNIVELQNTNLEGIYCPGHFVFTQLIKNGCRITYEGEGTYGWTLEGDEFFEGDMHLVGDELNLNGHTLVIEGNLIHEAGTINVNSGCLIVKGDYRIQSVEDKENNTYGEGTGILVMIGENDEVHVQGSFIMGSSQNHKDKLAAGKLYISGDFKQVTYSSVQNFCAGEKHETIFCGEYQQVISFENGAYNQSQFGALTFENGSADGIVLATEVVVTGALKNEASGVTGAVTLHTTGKITDGYYNGDVKIVNSHNMTEDWHIGGNLCVESYISQRGFKLVVEGDLDIYNGYVRVDGGYLECKENLNLSSSLGNRGWLYMINDSDYVLIHGNVNWTSALGASGWLTKGTLEIKGDFIQTITQYEDNFTMTGSHKTIFSGDNKQTITVNSTKSYFNIVEFTNTSEDGIYVTNEMPAVSLVANGVIVTFADNSVLGWTLMEDTVIDGSLVINSGELNLNGYSLTVNGDLVQKSGSLIMQNESDKLLVTGDFVTSSVADHTGLLTGGLLEVKGDFAVNSTNGAKCFVAEGKHTLKLSGSEEQNVACGSSQVQAATLVIDNLSEEGVVITGTVTVKSSVTDLSRNVKGEIWADTLGVINDGYFSGGLVLTGTDSLSTNVTVGGVLTVNKVLDVNGFVLGAGGINLNATMTVNGGGVNCAGDMNVNHYGSLVMTNETDQVIVDGSFVTNTIYSQEGKLTAGTLEVRRDFTQAGCAASFVAGQSHKTVLYGRNYRQTIKFTSPTVSGFNTVVITRPDRYYYFTPDLVDVAKEIIYDIRDIDPPAQVTGLMVTGQSASTVSLIWSETTDDVGVTGYEIYRDGVRVATANKTAYTDTGLLPETTYVYSVKAFDEAGNGSQISDSVTTTTEKDTENPTVPTELTVVRRSGSSITLRWNPSTDNVACAGYRVYRNDEEIAYVEGECTYKDTEASFGVEYTYKVQAVDTSGNESECSEPVTGCVVKPQITAIEPGDATIIGGGETITIKARFVDSGNSIGNRVAFEYSQDMTNWYMVNEKMSNQQVLSVKELYAECSFDTKLVESGEYVIRATLYDEDNNTDSEMVTYVIDNEAPPIVADLQGQSVNGCNVLKWTAVNAGDLKEYRIYRKSENGTAYALLEQKDGRELTEYYDNSVIVGTTYEYYITALDNNRNESAAGNVVMLVTTEDKEAPAVLSIKLDKEVAVQLTTVTVEAVDNLKVKEILFQYHDEESDIWVDIGRSKATKNQAVFEWDTTALTGSEYTLRAIAWDGNDNRSADFDVTVKVDNVGPAKINVTEVLTFTNHVSIRWDDVADEDLAYFAVEQVKGEMSEVVGTTEDTLGYHVTGLHSETQYIFRVVGYDTLGNRGTESEPIVVTTGKDTTAPYVTGFEPAESYFADSIPFVFSVADNDAVKSLTLEYSYDNENWQDVVTLTNEKEKAECTFEYNCDITSLNEGDVYFRITPADVCGNEGNSMTVAHKIDRTAPNAVSDLMAKDLCGSIELSWNTEDEDVSHYIIYRSEGDNDMYVPVEELCGETTYYDKNVQEEVTYAYKVVAVDIADNVSEYSNKSVATVSKDLTAPEIYGFTPVSGTSIGDGATITVVVQDSALESVLVEYRKNNGTWYKLGEKTEFSDVYAGVEFEWDANGLLEGEYEFRAIALDKNKQSSTKTASYYLDRTAPEIGEFTITSGNSRIELSWEASECNDFDKYVLLRKSALESEYKEITNTRENTYSDAEVVPEVTYTYKIQVWDKNGNYSESEPVSGFAHDIDDEAPVAVLPEEMIALENSAFTLDGTLSSDNRRIVKYEWDMGNGDILNGIIPEYTYTKEGSYTVKLTVWDAAGKSAETKMTVKVYDGTNYGRKDLYVVDKNNNPIPHAYVYYNENGRDVRSLMTDDAGKITIVAVPGTWNVAVYKEGYTPQEYAVRIDYIGQNPSESLSIVKNEFVIGDVKVTRMTLAQMLEAGIDFEDPNNYNKYMVRVTVEFAQRPLPEKLVAITDEGEATIIKSPVSPGPGHGGGEPDGNGELHICFPVGGEGEYTAVYVTTTETIKWMKDMFQVDLTMSNSAGRAFTLTDAVATLNLSSELELCGTKQGQLLSKEMGIIEGGSKKSVSWYIMGTGVGKYDFTVDFSANIMPFGVPFTGRYEGDVEVLSGKGLKLLIMPQMEAYIDEDYYIFFQLINGSGRTFYNLTTTFGTYEIPGAVHDTVLEQPGGGTSSVRTQDTTYRFPNANESPSINLLYGGEKIEIGIFESGQVLSGAYKERFNAPGDKDEVYYEMISTEIDEIMGSNLGIAVELIPTVSHVTKSVVRGISVNGLWGDPVDMTTGAFTEKISLLDLKCDPAIDFTIDYSSLHNKDKGEMGYGWSHSYESRIVDNGNELVLYLSPTNYINFIDKRDRDRIVRGTIEGNTINVLPSSPATDFVTLSDLTSDYTIKRNEDGTYRFTIENQEYWDYDCEGRLTKITKFNGKSVDITHGNDFMKITEPDSGMYIRANYNDAGLVTSVEDNAGRKVLLSYENECLLKITNAMDEDTSFVYDANNRLVSGFDDSGLKYVTNVYDEEGRVIEQDDADEETPVMTISYDVNAYGGTITTATDRNGCTNVYYSNGLGQITKIEDANGNEVEYKYNDYGETAYEINGDGGTTHYIFDDTGVLVGITDPMGNTTDFINDKNGNTIEIISPDSTSAKFEYDDQNRLLWSLSPTGKKTSYTYDEHGRATSETVEGLGTQKITYKNGFVESIEDYHGNITCYEYDAVGNMTSTKTPDGAVTRYEYDALGRNTKIIYPDGGIVEYTYDYYGNTTSIKDQKGGVATFEYNDNRWLVKSTNTLGEVTLYEHDNEGRITKRTNADGTVAETAYDGVGNVIKNINEDGSTYGYTYDKCNRVIAEKAPDGSVTKMEYYLNGKEKIITTPDDVSVLYSYDKVGNLIKSRDSAGNTYSYEYNPDSSLRKITDPLGNSTFYSYDKFGRLITEMDANENTRKYEYDALGNCTKSTNAMGHEVTMTYDSMSRVRSISMKVQGETYTISYEYDSMGRVVSYTDEEGNVTKSAYDLMGNVTSTMDALGNVSSQMTYDSAGNIIKVTDALGVSSEYTYDAMGNLTKLTAYKGTANEAVDIYEYDAAGRVLKAKDAEEGESSYTYDKLGNITSVTNPNGGVTKYTYDVMGRVTSTENAVGSVNSYSYNNLGQLAKAVNAREQGTTYTYDALGRISTMTDEAGTISYTYDKVGNVLEVKETKADGTTNTIKRTYDVLNRVVTYTDYRGETVKYGYDELGNVISLTYPGGEIVRYDYYKNGYLKSVTDWDNRITNYEYDGNGKLKSQTRPDGTVEVYTYNDAGQLLSQTDKKGDTVIQSITYEYDSAGNIVKTTQSGSTGDMAELTTATMEYDEANRLTKYNGEEVIYDADGNMIYGPLDGVMVSYEYDCRNRLIKAGNTTYEYDAEDNRIAVQTDKLLTEYTVENNMSSLSQVLKETEYAITEGTVSEECSTTYYVHGNGLIAQENEEYGYLTYHFNNIGSTTAITDEQGNLIRVYTYGAYGELLSGDTSGIAFLYNGQYGVITDENSLYYMRARYYNVDIKRFINQDVLTGTITDSPTLNRYSYCEGNPVSLSDPFGLSPRWQVNVACGILDGLMDFAPIIGDYRDIKAGINYIKQGNYLMGGLCFAGVMPFIGTVAGATVKALKGCDRMSDLIKFGTKVTAKTLVFSYGAYELGSAVVDLYNRHVVNGEEWDRQSSLTLLQGFIGGALAWTAGRSLADDLMNMDTSLITGSSWCFVAGTIVHTSEGTTPIEEIEPGDYVLAYDEETGESGYQKVVRLFRNTTDELAYVTVASGEPGEAEEIICTPGHKFYVEGEWIAAGELESGDVLTLADGSKTKVHSVTVEELETPTIIYNFEVENWHNYYVADEGVLVHNENGGCGNPNENSSSISPRRASAQQKLADAALGINNKAIDPVTGLEIDDLIIGDSRGNLIIAPKGGGFDLNRPNGVDIHSFYPNGSNYQRYNPIGHGNNTTPHGHGHALGTGPNRRGQGDSLDVFGNVVPFNSQDAHWPIY